MSAFKLLFLPRLICDLPSPARCMLHSVYQVHIYGSKIRKYAGNYATSGGNLWFAIAYAEQVSNGNASHGKDSQGSRNHS